MGKTYAVIGDPIEHSLSPSIHNTLYEIYKLDCEYIPLKISIEQIPDFFNTVLGKKISGCNVTMPDKQAVIPYLSWVDPDALLCQSVNTISAEETLKGWSTDAPGLRTALAQFGCRYQGKNLLLYGAGSAASAIALDFARNGGESIAVCNRSRAKAEAICSLLSKNAPLPAKAVWDETFLEALETCDLLINTTPLGMSHTGLQFASLDFLEALPGHAFVCDLIYNPFETRLLARAKELGLSCTNGLPMLIFQAFLSFQKWFGILPTMEDYKMIYEKLVSELGKRG